MSTNSHFDEKSGIVSHQTEFGYVANIGLTAYCKQTADLSKDRFYFSKMMSFHKHKQIAVIFFPKCQQTVVI